MKAIALLLVAVLAASACATTPPSQLGGGPRAMPGTPAADMYPVMESRDCTVAAGRVADIVGTLDVLDWVDDFGGGLASLAVLGIKALSSGVSAAADASKGSCTPL